MKKKFLLALALVAIITVLFAITINASEPTEVWDVSYSSSDNITAYLYEDPDNIGFYTLSIEGTGNMKNWSYYDKSCWHSLYASKITSITIEDGVTSIGSCAFYDCSAITSVVVPNSVTKIGSSAFQGCSSLESITLPFIGASKDATTYSAVFGYIFGYAERSSSSTVSFTKSEEFTSTQYGSVEGATWQYSCYTYYIMNYNGYLGERYGLKSYFYYIPESLKEVIITDASTISAAAFNGCSNLTSISIPSTVTSIGSSGFYNCTALTSVNIESLSSWCGISFDNPSANPLYYCENLYLNGNLVTKLENLNGVVRIGDYAFYGYSPLTSIELPNTVASIGASAFFGCADLTRVNLQSGLESIGSESFKGCSSLKNIIIPDSVTFIGSSAFGGCSSLESMSFPYVMGEYVPLGYIFGTSSYEGGVATEQRLNSSEPTFYIPSVLRNIIVTGGDISLFSFRNCANIEAITISRAVKSIGASAFTNCTGLKTVNIESLEAWCEISFGDEISNPLYYGAKLYLNGELVTKLENLDSVTSIGNYAFYNYLPLISIVLPNTITSIGDSAFYNCSQLTSVELPDTVTSIGKYAFSNCSQLEGVELPSSLDSIGAGAFKDCVGITDIVVPNSVTKIGLAAFQGCNSLESITLPFVGASRNATYYTAVFGYIFGYNTKEDESERSYMQSYDFVNIAASKVSDATWQYSCYSQRYLSDSYNLLSYYYYIPSSLKKVTITDMSVIPVAAFKGCSNITSIAIPNSVTQIGGYAFQDCSGLTDVKLPDSLTSISNYAFQNCSGLSSVKLSDSLTSLSKYAFQNCTGLTSIEIPDSVTSIGSSVLNGCSSLVSVKIPFIGGGDAATYASSYLFGYIFGSETYTGGQRITQYYNSYSTDSTSYYIPNSLRHVTVTGGKIFYGAFYNCANLTSIVLPESITSIGYCAFYNCDSLTNIVIPQSVTTIGNYAFNGCSSLTSIVIPEGVSSIGNYAFRECISLTSIAIPEGVTTIGDYAFSGCSNLTIYCEAESKPSGWASRWNYSNCPVVWGYSHENTLATIFTFKGYSFNRSGGFAVGFEIDYDAKALYEELTGKTIEIGVVFAGYENLGGKQPLDENGEAIALENGRVIKGDITEFGYKYYDFMLTGFDDSLKDVKLVIAGYIFDGEAVKYVQANGMSDTVNFITYNQAAQG